MRLARPPLDSGFRKIRNEDDENVELLPTDLNARLDVFVNSILI